jgi:hypothetical protein
MLKNSTPRSANRKNQKGMAVIEAIPVLFTLVIIFNFSLGFFGALHTGILNSIGAYNYAFETFRYRSNLTYFRPGVEEKNYASAQNRVHGVVKDGTEQATNDTKGRWPATVREVTFNYKKESIKAAEEKEAGRAYGNRGDRTNVWFADSNYEPESSTSIQTPRIWIKTVYGMCLTADCCADGNCKRAGE